MPFNLLLLPLLGGFIFVRYWNRTKYHAIRADKERILLFASVRGFVFLAVAWIVASLVAWQLPCGKYPQLPCVAATWRKFLPFDYSATSLFALLLGATLWKPLNGGVLSLWCREEKRLRERKEIKSEWLWWRRLRRGWDDREEITRVITQDGDPLDVLLRKAEMSTRTIMVTMKSSKVYIGFVIIPSNPAQQTRTIGLFPVVSGYREERTYKLILTTYYAEALGRIDEGIDKLKAERDAILQQQTSAKARPDDPKNGDEEERRAAQTEYDRLEEQAGEKQQNLDDLASVVNDFFIALPVGEVASVHIYRDDVQREFFLPKPENASQPDPELRVPQA